MKKAGLFCVLLAVVSICSAQRVTFIDLKFVLYHNVGEAEDYLSQKGFSFSKINTLGKDSSGISYGFYKNSKHSKEYVSVSKTGRQEIFYSSDAYTNYQSDYLLFKSSIKKLGFKLISTRPDDGSLAIVYRKENLEITFYITKDSETELTSYYIGLDDNALKIKAMSNLK